MRATPTLLALPAPHCWPPPPPARRDWELDLDLRAVASDATTSVLDGGYSPTRFSRAPVATAARAPAPGLRHAARRGVESPSRRLRLGSLLCASVRADRSVSAVPSLSAQSPAGASQGRRVLRAHLAGEPGRRLGVSLHAVVLGAEQLDCRGAAHHRRGGARSTGSAPAAGCHSTSAPSPESFGWNEGAGAALADGGFILDDRQTPLFDTVGRLESPERRLHASRSGRSMDVRDITAALDLDDPGRLLITALRYDNRADPSASDAAAHVLTLGTPPSTPRAHAWNMVRAGQ